jgi:hypothetical protein
VLDRPSRALHGLRHFLPGLRPARRAPGCGVDARQSALRKGLQSEVLPASADAHAESGLGAPAHHAGEAQSRRHAPTLAPHPPLARGHWRGPVT